MTMVWFEDRLGNRCGFNLYYFVFIHDHENKSFVQFRDHYRIFDVDALVIEDAIIRAQLSLREPRF